MKNVNHKYIFLNALRTAILFSAGFLIYEILKELEKIWNLESSSNKMLHFYQRKTYKFITILLIDLILLYILFFLTGEYF